MTFRKPTSRRCEAFFTVAQSDPAKAPADATAATQSSKPSQNGKSCSIDDGWLRAAEGMPDWERRVTSANGDLYDIDGLPK